MLRRRALFAVWAVVGLVVFRVHTVCGESVIADYDAEVRSADGRVDVPTLISRLKALNVNSYFYLVWHRDTDWEDLKIFLPAARDAGIDVWVYLVPPSESPPHTQRFSEPFRLDYARWAEEIARLSLSFSNLKAFVIDDFWANRSFFSPSYLETMRLRAGAINPELMFWPLMYYGEIDRPFVEAYGVLIDGVVAAYPQNEGTVALAWRQLHDLEDEPEAWSITYPPNTRSSIGDFAEVRNIFVVEQNVRSQIAISFQDNYTGPTAEYHLIQLLIDGGVVWEIDVAGGTRGWEKAVVDVTGQVLGKETVSVSLRVYDKKPVSNFGMTVRFQEPTSEGLRAQNSWTPHRAGAWQVTYAGPYRSAGRFHIPLVVMVAAERSQFVKRWGEPASAERLRDKLAMALAAMRRGLADGVVTYALKKEPGDEVYAAIRKLLLKASTSTTADFDGSGAVNFDDLLLFAQSYGVRVGDNATVEGQLDLDLDGQIGFGVF
ncbi:MAG: hypothetical protein O3B73_18630, partial [bacterium]|nr:hypothetical protein [bacterium]